MADLAPTLERRKPDAPLDDAPLSDTDTVLRLLDFEVTGPLADGNRMNLTLCTSTTTTCTGAKKQR